MRSTGCGVRNWRQAGIASALALGLTGFFAGQAAAQELGRISGRVQDATTQAPLSDVQVYLQGANLGSLSRQNGVYVILNVPAGTYELRAERIGLTMVTRQITVTGGQAVEANFEMTAQALGLDEIVVTGTAGAARRREVGNSVAQINTVDLPERPTSVMSMLQSMAPGVEVNVAGGGGELGQGHEIRIRGINSINNNSSPIIFIDGIRIMSANLPTRSTPDIQSNSGNNTPSALAQLNPNDIERIEIISGPAASTLYGTEASAGVIQVFTRRGTDRAPVWTVETQLGTLWNQRFGTGDHTPAWHEGTPDEVHTSSKYIYMDPWICTGPFKCGVYMDVPLAQLHSLSVRGGGQSLQYFVSGGLDSEEGSTNDDNLERWTVRGNFTLTPMEDLVLQWNTSYTNTWQQNTPSGNNAGGLALNVFRQEQGYFGTADPKIVNETTTAWDVTKEIERFTTGGTLTYSPLTNFTNRFTIGYDFSQQESRNVRAFGFRLFPQGGIDVSVYSRRFLSFDYVGTYSFDVMQNLRSSFSWGGQAVGDFEATVSAFGEGFPGAALPTVNSSSSTLGFEDREKVWNSGFFFQNVFDVSSKYFVTLGLRVDGNSTFGKGFGLAMYPKASASWVVSDESFWRPGFGEMKLRAAWGKSGRAPDALIAQRTWTNQGLAGEPAFLPQNLGNPDIGPEVTTEFEAGFDAAWFNDRVRPRFTYYKQTTKDAIQSLSTIPSLGFTSSVNFNVGEVQNFGKELGVDFTVLRRRDWGFDVGTNVSHNSNEVTKWLGVNDPSSESRIGRPIATRTWNMYHNPEGMGTSRRNDGTYQAQSCQVLAPGFPAGEQGDSVPRPGIDPNIHSCSYGSMHVYGYPLNRPSVLAGGTATLRMPYGITVSARGDYQGGHGYWRGTNPIPIGRNVRSPACFPYYANDENVQLKLDTPAIWVQRCNSALGGQGSYDHKGDIFQLRTVSATVPMDFLFPDRIQNSTLTLVFGNAWTVTRGIGRVLWGNYRAGAERIPEATTFRAGLRVVF
jgi:outer membrane receptor protein involved in Fe transport